MSDDTQLNGQIPENAHEDPGFASAMEAIFEEEQARGTLTQPPPAPRPLYRDESDRLFIGQEFTLGEFKKWWAAQALGTAPFNAVGYHHTQVPDHRIWTGIPSLQGVFNYYRDELGWPEGVGPHLWVYSGDGPYSSGTPRICVGTHPAHDGIGITGRNGRWLHIEHIWNGDASPFSEAMKKVSGQVLGIVCAASSAANRTIPMTFVKGGHNDPATPLGIMYHRDQNPIWPGDGGWPKSCPGRSVTHENLDNDLIAFAGGGGVSSTAFSVGQRLVVESGPLNLRSAPGLAYAILNELESGAEMDVLEGPFDVEGFSWYRVAGPENGPGWLAGDFLRVAD